MVFGESSFEAAKYSSLFTGRQCFSCTSIHAGCIVPEKRTQTGIADHHAVADHNAVAHHDAVADQDAISDENSIT